MRSPTSLTFWHWEGVIHGLTALQSPVFLANNRLGLVTATPSSMSRLLLYPVGKLMDARKFVRIHLGGIISEGYERGFIEVRPAPYNVVLEDDDTYKGEIKVGFKFFTKEEITLMEARELLADGKQQRKPICSEVMNLWRIVWLKLLCLIGHKNSSSERKQQ